MWAFNLKMYWLLKTHFLFKLGSISANSLLLYHETFHISKQNFVEIGVSCNFAPPQQFLSASSKYKSKVCDSLSDILLVRITDKTHYVIKMSYVENLHVGVNMCLTLWTYALTEDT